MARRREAHLLTGVDRSENTAQSRGNGQHEGGRAVGLTDPKEPTKQQGLLALVVHTQPGN